MALKALIFDVDGTLANTEHDGHLRAFNEAFDFYGLDCYWDSELYAELLSVSGGKERLAFFIKKYKPDLLNSTTIVISESLSNTQSLGNVLYTDYIHLFQISGMILLVAMIGAIVLTFRRRPGLKRQSYIKQISRERNDEAKETIYT